VRWDLVLDRGGLITSATLAVSPRAPTLPAIQLRLARVFEGETVLLVAADTKNGRTGTARKRLTRCGEFGSSDGKACQNVKVLRRLEVARARPVMAAR